MPSLEPHELQYTHHEVIDDHQQKVGKITDVIYDLETEQPRWAIVKMHVFGREHVAPLDGAYVTDDGRVVISHDRNTVKQAPIAPHDHVLSRELEQEAARHYGLAA